MSIKINHLTQIYGQGTAFEKKALDDINLEIQDGEFIGLIGHTGSGKSTLIQHLNALLVPTSGEVLLNGENIYADKSKLKSIRQRVGLVFQYPEHQLFEIDVMTDVCFGPKNQGLGPKECKERALEALKLVGLKEKYYKSSPFELSGGQKRRVAIAGVLAMEPECIVLDEATAMLDPVGRREVLSAVHRLNREKGITVVLITHHMNEAEDADRVVVMDDGKVIMDGAPRQVFTQVERLRSMGLTVPDTVDLLDRLRKDGLDVPLTALTVEECADASLAAVSK